jgi:hypothetical protein
MIRTMIRLGLLFSFFVGLIAGANGLGSKAHAEVKQDQLQSSEQNYTPDEVVPQVNGPHVCVEALSACLRGCGDDNDCVQRCGTAYCLCLSRNGLGCTVNS